MKMRRAVARTRAAWIAAEGDGFSLLIAAVGVTAIALLQLDQGKMPRLDPDAAQLDRFHLFEHRRRPEKCSRPGSTGTGLRHVVQVNRLGGHRRFPALLCLQPQAPRAPERRAPRVGRIEY